MKKHLTIIALLLAMRMIFGSAMAQESLAGFSHAIVAGPEYDNDKYDIHGFGEYLERSLQSKTDLIMLPYGVPPPSDVPLSQIMVVGLSHTDKIIYAARNEATLHFLTLNWTPIYSISQKANGFGMSNLSDVKKAIDKCIEELNKIRPSFDPSKTIAATAEHFQLSADDFYNYLDDTEVTVDDIEGVWQEEGGNYVVGVIRTPGSRIDRYKGFIIEETTSRQEWGVGAVKFELTPSAISGRLTSSFKMRDFSSQQMQVSFTRGIISFTYTPAGGEQQTFKYIKMYPGGGLDDPKVSQAEESLPSNVLATGSGFVLGRNRVITNSHVITDGSYYEIAFSDTLRYPLRLLEEDQANDIAVLAILPNESGQYPSIEGVQVADPSKVRLGEEVFTIGFPLAGILSGEHTATDGSVSAVSGLQDDPRHFQVSVPVQPGNSGGPLFNERGEVVGVITSKLSDQYAYEVTKQLPQNVNFAVKINYVLPLLGSSKVDFDTSEENTDLARADLIELLVEKVGQIIVFR